MMIISFGMRKTRSTSKIRQLYIEKFAGQDGATDYWLLSGTALSIGAMTGTREVEAPISPAETSRLLLGDNLNFQSRQPTEQSFDF